MNTIIFDVDIANQLNILHKDTYHVFCDENFCFDKFKLIFPDWEKEITVELISGTKVGKASCYYGISNKTICVEWDFEKYEYDLNESQGITNNCIKPGEDVLDEQEKYQYFSVVQDILDACHYIMTTKRERIQKKKIMQSNIKQNNENKIKENEPKKVYLLDEIVDYVNENGLTIQSNGTHKINCPCWSVRGHYRHYKSGKVVFIKNYEKGKEKGKINPKDKFYGV